MTRVGVGAIGAFDTGNVAHPSVLGFVGHGSDKPPDSDTQNRVIKTPGGHSIRFEDAPGAKEVIVKSDGGLTITMDDLGVGEFDPHGMAPVAVLASLKDLGGRLPPTYVIGCRPADVSEGIGLSAPVEAAIPVAIDTVRAVLRERIPVPTVAENGAC